MFDSVSFMFAHLFYGQLPENPEAPIEANMREALLALRSMGADQIIEFGEQHGLDDFVDFAADSDAQRPFDDPAYWGQWVRYSKRQDKR